MSNIKNIFDDRRRRERETRVTYSKYIFNSHLVMFLIIVLGAGLINYSRWLENASKLEMKTVFIAASAIFSYLLVSLKVKTFIKEADAIFLLPLEKYYGKVAIKTGIILTSIHLLFLVIFYFIIKFYTFFSFFTTTKKGYFRNSPLASYYCFYLTAITPISTFTSLGNLATSTQALAGLTSPKYLS